MGDNADVFRLVGSGGVASSPSAFLTFVYDSYGGAERIIPRAYTFLDYTQGGAPTDVGAADLIHGESGDDTIHGQAGNDVLFGEGQDDDIYGGTGFDRIYGGTGQDGILGDDGKLLTSRNGSAEPLNRLTSPNEEQFVELNDQFTGAIVAILGELKKEAVLAAWTLGGADTIYGGLGDDFLHGGAGDDAISGAEALRELYDEAPQVDADPLALRPADDEVRRLRRRRPVVEDRRLPAELRRLPARRGDRPAAERRRRARSSPRTAATASSATTATTGSSAGRTATGSSAASATTCMNLDDNLETNGGRNDRPEDDVRFRDGDFAYGGAGRDVLIANTAQDRMFDWHGEFNSFFVPFSVFGRPTVNRLFAPDIRDFIRELAYAAGTDSTLTPSEPFDELALVEPDDGDLYRDQTGGPRDPQPGTIGGVQRDEVGGKNLHCPCDVIAARPHLEVPLDDRRRARACQRRVRHRPRDRARHRRLLDLRGHERVGRQHDEPGRPAADHADHRRLRLAGERRGRLRARPTCRATATATGCSTSARPGSSPRRASSTYNVRPGLYTNTVTVEADRRERRQHRGHRREPARRQRDRDRHQEGDQRRRPAAADASRRRPTPRPAPSSRSAAPITWTFRVTNRHGDADLGRRRARRQRHAGRGRRRLQPGLRRPATRTRTACSIPARYGSTGRPAPRSSASTRTSAP